jgi:hypothetical protein
MARLKSNAELIDAYNEIELTLSLIKKLVRNKDFILLELNAMILAHLAGAIAEYEKTEKTKTD